MKNPSVEDSKTIYRALRDPKYGVDQQHEKREGIVLLRKVARSCREEEFVDFTSNNQIPAVKLTPAEMEVLKGGITPVIFVVGAGLAIAGYLMRDAGH